MDKRNNLYLYCLFLYFFIFWNEILTKGSGDRSKDKTNKTFQMPEIPSHSISLFQIDMEKEISRGKREIKGPVFLGGHTRTNKLKTQIAF